MAAALMTHDNSGVVAVAGSPLIAAALFIFGNILKLWLISVNIY